MAKVYVSSTIADLRPERQAVLEWLRLARHQAVDSYLPDSETVRDSCLKDVAACDLYLLIVGHRYGFQPAEDNPEGLSITQLEFRRAGECGIPRVALLRTSIPDVRLSDLQDPARAPLVLAFRDEVASQVRPAEFADLQGLIQGLSTGVQGELDKQEKRYKRSAGQGMAGRALRLAPRPVFLAGRDGLLAELDARLAGDGTGPQMVTLAGLGGAGKTSVAVEYAHRHLGEVAIAWQFPVEDRSVLEAGFGELAAQLGTADGGDPVAAVHGVLAASRVQWLLLFDNVPDRASVEAFLPPAGPGRVLITSQSAIWPRGQAVDVPVLDTEVAAGFLVNRTGDGDERAAEDLAGELGGLPLALEQAAAYVQATGSTLAGYLSLFRDRRADLLARGQVAGHPAHVTATLKLAVSRLEAEAPAAAGLLRLLAFLAPEPVPWALLLSDAQVANGLDPEIAAAVGPLLGDLVAAGDAVAALRRYSLVTPARDGTVLVHRLVQAVTRDQLSADVAAEWQQAAAALIQAVVPADTENPAAWPVCAVLLPHARAVLALTSGGMWLIAHYLGYSGSYPAARDLFRLIADARMGDDAYGAEHPDTLAARQEAARLTGQAGNTAEARDQYAALLPIVERVLGPEHPDTLGARGNLARWTGDAGDAAEARDEYAALLPIEERALGPEHPETLAARSNLAGFTGGVGDAAGARDQFAALLPVDERMFGSEHLQTLIIRHELARWTGEAGDAAGARDQFATLLPVLERVLGPEHPHTLAAWHELARWTGEAGDLAAALDQVAALQPVYEQVLGPDHPHTLDVRHEIAIRTGDAGDAAAARDQLAALLPARERVLGPEHPNTLLTRHELAAWTGVAGDAAAAREQQAAVLPICKRVLGSEHPDTLNVRGSTAYWTGKAGNAAAARDQYAALLPDYERVLGLEHPKTLVARAILAHWTGEAGDAAAARDQYAALLPVQERIMRPGHPSPLASRAELARWTGEAGDAAAARDQYAALLPVQQQIIGPERWRTLSDRAELARWTGEAGDAAAARDQYAALLPIVEQILGAEDPGTLAVRANLARWTREADGDTNPGEN